MANNGKQCNYPVNADLPSSACFDYDARRRSSSSPASCSIDEMRSDLEHCDLLARLAQTTLELQTARRMNQELVTRLRSVCGPRNCPSPLAARAMSPPMFSPVTPYTPETYLNQGRAKDGASDEDPSPYDSDEGMGHGDSPQDSLNGPSTSLGLEQERDVSPGHLLGRLLGLNFSPPTPDASQDEVQECRRARLESLSNKQLTVLSKILGDQVNDLNAKLKRMLQEREELKEQQEHLVREFALGPQ